MFFFPAGADTPLPSEEKFFGASASGYGSRGGPKPLRPLSSTSGTLGLDARTRAALGGAFGGRPSSQPVGSKSPYGGAAEPRRGTPGGRPRGDTRLAAAAAPRAQPQLSAGVGIYTSQPTRRYRWVWLRSQTRP